MKLLVVLLAFAVAGFASETITGLPGGTGYAFPETDDIADSYAYNQEEVLPAFPASYNDYSVIDDFGNEWGTVIESYTCWAVTTVAVPTELELFVVADNSGVPPYYGEPVSQKAYPVTVSDSGFTFAGYTVYKTVVNTSATLIVDLPCWLGTHRNDGGNWYPACGTTVSGNEAYRTVAPGWSWEPISNSIAEGDLFKIVYIVICPLGRTTWAQIKSSF